MAETTKSMVNLQIGINDQMASLRSISDAWAEFSDVVPQFDAVNTTIELLILTGQDSLNTTQTMLDIIRNSLVHHRSDN